MVLPDFRFGEPNHEVVRNTAAERAEIARHVEEFLARGGKIQQIPIECSAFDVRGEKSHGNRNYRIRWVDKSMQEFSVR